MRKERNNFFQESSYNQGYYYNNQMPQMGMMPEVTNYSSFYSSNNISNELNTRLSRLERQVNRLESRINKLENNNVNINIQEDIDKDTNMYMI